MFCIAISQFCIYALLSFLLAELVVCSADFCSDFTGAEDIAARKGLFPLSKVVQKVVQSVGLFWIFARCSFNSVKAYFVYSELIERILVFESCTGWYSYKFSSKDRNAVPLYSIRVQQRATYGSSIFRKIPETPVGLGKFQLKNTSKAKSSAEAPHIQPDEPALLRPDNIFEGIDESDYGHVEQTLHQKDCSAQSASDLSAFQRMEQLCEKAWFYILTSVFEALDRIAQELVVTVGNSVLPAALTAGSDASTFGRESLQTEIGKVKAGLSFRQDGKSKAKPAGLYETRDLNVHALNERQTNRKLSFERSTPVQQARDVTASDQAGALQKINTALCTE